MSFIPLFTVNGIIFLRSFNATFLPFIRYFPLTISPLSLHHSKCNVKLKYSWIFIRWLSSLNENHEAYCSPRYIHANVPGVEYVNRQHCYSIYNSNLRNCYASFHGKTRQWKWMIGELCYKSKCTIVHYSLTFISNEITACVTACRSQKWKIPLKTDALCTWHLFWNVKKISDIHHDLLKKTEEKPILLQIII